MDLIDRQDAIDVKAEFLNEYVIRDTEAQTLSDRSYAKGWNECNCHWIDAIKSLPSAQPEQTHNIMDFARYQVAWLESHNDIILEPELEKWMVRMLYDTAECYIMEHPEPKRKTGKWIGGELGHCSVCGHEGCASDIWDRCEEYFCPACGAKMEGE